MSDEQVDARILSRIMQQQNEERGNMALYQIDSSDILEELDHLLKGEIKDFLKGEWKPLSDKGTLVNEKGRLAIMFVIQSHINKVVQLSDFKINDVMRMMREICQTLILNIAFYGEEWEIPEMYHDALIDGLDHFIFSITMSAKDGGMRVHMSTIQKFVERIGYDLGKESKKEMKLGG